VNFLKLSRLHVFAFAPDLKKQAQGGWGDLKNKHKTRRENTSEMAGEVHGGRLIFSERKPSVRPK
jgi:hypothetical protein